MSKQALGAGLKAYPENIIGTTRTPFDKNAPVDANVGKRIYFMEGYKQAEKDCMLKVEDLQLLHTFLYAVKYNKQGAFTFSRLSNEQYEEVLHRFNQNRKK